MCVCEARKTVAYVRCPQPSIKGWRQSHLHHHPAGSGPPGTEIDNCVCQCPGLRLLAGVHGVPLPQGLGALPPHLAHLQLKEAPFLLHLLRDLGPADLRADHPVQPGMLLLLLLDFGSTGEKSKIQSDASRHAVQTGRPGHGPATRPARRTLTEPVRNVALRQLT